MENQNLILAQNEILKKGNIWLYFLLLGWSYGSMGKIGLQILFYLTLGGFGFWTLIRLFTLNSDIKKYNQAIADKYGLDSNQRHLIGI